VEHSTAANGTHAVEFGDGSVLDKQEKQGGKNRRRNADEISAAETGTEPTDTKVPVSCCKISSVTQAFKTVSGSVFKQTDATLNISSRFNI
jgi:hypothetical protein